MLNLSHSSAHNGAGRMMSEDEPSIGTDASQYWTVWENKLQTLNHGERITFLAIFSFVTCVAIVGNLLTIYVVVMRKQRLLFKACLLSLALSDLIYAASCGANYISKLIFDTSALWYLGRYSCTIVPFLQTSSLLSGSMSLVAIALDRYMAIFSRRKSHWQPGTVFCVTGIGVIWSVSAGISSPMFFSYEIVNIIVVPEQQENFYVAQLCSISSDDKDEALFYYFIIFIFVFLPLFVTFVSFNAIIAREIYKRRKAPGNHDERNKKHNEDSSSSAEEGKTSNDTNSTSVRNNGSKDASGESRASAIVTSSQQQQQIFIVPTQQPNNDRCNERQRRQMRMFKVILVLMCVFIMFRLPTWVFLLVKLNYLVRPRLQFLLSYSFSAIGIANSMANPFLYTFLSETIRCTAYIRAACHKFCKLCRPRVATQGNYANNATIFAKDDVLNQRKGDNGGVYLGNQK